MNVTHTDLTTTVVEMNSVGSPRLERTSRTSDVHTLLDQEEGGIPESRPDAHKSTFRRIPADEMGENKCSRFCLAWFSCCFAIGRSKPIEQ